MVYRLVEYCIGPQDKPKTEKLPLVLWIHGGPVAQDEYEFDMTIQKIAAEVMQWLLSTIAAAMEEVILLHGQFLAIGVIRK